MFDIISDVPAGAGASCYFISLEFVSDTLSWRDWKAIEILKSDALNSLQCKATQYLNNMIQTIRITLPALGSIPLMFIRFLPFSHWREPLDLFFFVFFLSFFLHFQTFNTMFNVNVDSSNNDRQRKANICICRLFETRFTLRQSSPSSTVQNFQNNLSSVATNNRSKSNKHWSRTFCFSIHSLI